MANGHPVRIWVESYRVGIISGHIYQADCRSGQVNLIKIMLYKVIWVVISDHIRVKWYFVSLNRVNSGFEFVSG